MPPSRTEYLQDLLKASETRSIPDILKAQARLLYARNNDGKEAPDRLIPTSLKPLCDFITLCPPEELAATEQRISSLFKTDTFTDALSEDSQMPPEQSDKPQEWSKTRLPKPEELVFDTPSDSDRDHYDSWPPFPFIFIYIGTLYKAWARLWTQSEKDDRPLAPLAPLVEAWQQKQIEPDYASIGIAPNGLRETRMAHHDDDQYGQLLSDTVGPIQDIQQEELPFLEMPKQGQIVPVLPLQLYDHSIGALKPRSRGAPISLRLFFEVLMSVRRRDRWPNHSFPLTVTLGDLIAWIWPRGWHRTKNLPQLRQALRELGELRIEWERREWNLVIARSLPTARTKLDDPIVFHVFTLPDSDRGPRIDRSVLRKWGLDNARAYRAYLRLAYLWDEIKIKRGGYRVYATRPEVLRNPQGQILDVNGQIVLDKRDRAVTAWNHPQAVQIGIERNPAADYVPTLGPEDLAILCFDENSKSRQQIADRAREARQVLKKMEKAGTIIQEFDSYGGIRILEPVPGQVR